MSLHPKECLRRTCCWKATSSSFPSSTSRTLCKANRLRRSTRTATRSRSEVCWPISVSTTFGGSFRSEPFSVAARLPIARTLSKHAATNTNSICGYSPSAISWSWPSSYRASDSRLLRTSSSSSSGSRIASLLRASLTSRQSRCSRYCLTNNWRVEELIPTLLFFLHNQTKASNKYQSSRQVRSTTQYT